MHVCVYINTTCAMFAPNGHVEDIDMGGHPTTTTTRWINKPHPTRGTVQSRCNSLSRFFVSRSSYDIDFLHISPGISHVMSNVLQTFCGYGDFNVSIHFMRFIICTFLPSPRVCALG